MTRPTLAWSWAVALAAISLSVLPDAAALPSPASLGTGLRFLYQNDLDWQRAADAPRRQPGYILLTEPLSQPTADSDCRAIGESLAPIDPNNLDPGLESQLTYQIHDGAYPAQQRFWVSAGNAVSLSASSKLEVVPDANKPSPDTRLPAICTQSAPWNHANSTDTSARWQLSANYGHLDFQGYRDALSFRFLGVPYANPTERFAYSTVYDNAKQASIPCQLEGRSNQCPQTAGTDKPYTEQCLVTSIFTPYLPTRSQVAKRQHLRPILLWIHGGGYTSGSGLDFTFDGGNLASRSDIVVLTTNYRLGALGHLAYNDQIRGNYGLGDLVTVLKWIQNYGPTFGGDPAQVTIAGQSAGAQHVEHLLASPAAAGLFHRAIVMSGQGQDANTVNPTIESARSNKTQAIIDKVGCGGGGGDDAALLDCLRRVDVATWLGNPYTGTVQDGTYIDSPRLDMRSADRATGHVNRVPVVWGHMRDERGSLGRVPPASETDLRKALTFAGISAANQDLVVNDPVAFPVDAYGVQNLTVTVDTDYTYACGIEAMAYASAANGVFPRTYAYVYDQRAFQIPNYDPNAVCQPRDGRPSSGDYYYCHSGDLMTVFGTAGSAFRLPYRDDEDLAWVTLIVDQVSAFVRTGYAAPSKAYLEARGREYALTLDRATKGESRWTSVDSTGSGGGGYRAMSFGPMQKMTGLARPLRQCKVLGKSLPYIAKL
ncbi:uncharacterized protein PFL1_04308 [Pseudozyma flocculosa PF-1]|uniref:Related to Para-nitrobenzyl esterase n=2 Tax=Pseudozyma flocculosa TaxID=84751 RepID=A0A5C3FE50_9BASI|nr:uncharacterized protein PFL1_04308 [Pseudozyma flocculosa PF-1]EPQ27981.1 hypothetical protein PFL1_04308 [Pseudozyma flocculosa PF-1]SPO41629.1 related to Para-nitrobenzyl esterase [Pseudozyma flocculosa]